MDGDAEQHEPPPQHLLQGLRQGAADAVQRPGLAASGGPVELDGRPAQGRQRPARHLAQRQRVGRPHVPDRGRLQGPPDRRRLCRVARSQRAADRDQADQGHVGNASAAFAQRRVRQLRDHVVPAGRPAGPHSAHRRQLRAAGAEGRPRAAGHQGLQPVQVRVRCRVGLAQHRRSLPPGQLLRRARRHRRHDRIAHVRRPRTPAWTRACWAPPA